MRKNNFSWIKIGGLIFVLIAGGFIQFMFKDDPSSRLEVLPVDTIVHRMNFMDVTDIKIAETESMSVAVSEGLGFNDYQYRQFKGAGLDFSVYLAFWGDRQRHFLDIGTHAPDNCWVTNGWKMDPKLPKHKFRLQDGNELPAYTWPAETRVFRHQDQVLYVFYWHLFDGEPLDYSRYGTGKTFGFIADNLRYYWRGTSRQYFLRISSSIPFAQLQNSPEFQQMLTGLAQKIPLTAAY